MISDRCVIVVRTNRNIEVFRDVYDWWTKDGCLFVRYLYKDLKYGLLEPKMGVFNINEWLDIEEF